MSKTQKDITLYKAIILDSVPDQEFELAPFDMNDSLVNYTWDVHENIVAERKTGSLAISSFSNKHITGTSKIEKKGILFFTIPFDTGWKVLVNGEERTLLKCNSGFSGLMISPGEYDIELSYSVPFINVGLCLSILSLILFGGLVFYWHRVDPVTEELS